ncbi:amino acid permease-domain-containing protein [Obelidium mucronatum]|nr:amino acid permease-domain-containing protein [Obelidium mucronatum]
MSTFLTSTSADARASFVIENAEGANTNTNANTNRVAATPTIPDAIHVDLVIDSSVPLEGEFNGWGRVSVLAVDSLRDKEYPPNGQLEKKQTLSEAAATAIAANDIAGSVLYTLGVTTLAAGRLAPVSLVLVALTLAFPFLGVVEEVGRRVPLNGGIYSCALLAADAGRSLASVAACCSLLAYMASAVVAAASAAAYCAFEFALAPSLEYWAAVALLAVFGLLTLAGVKESSAVSVAILALHLLTIVLVAVAAVVQLAKSGTAIAYANFVESHSERGWAMDLFLGYCVGMLGVTGFEKSANYIEEQKPGVYPKTLRNMCILSFVCNPVLSVLSLCILPLSAIKENSGVVISLMADASFGKWLRVLNDEG